MKLQSRRVYLFSSLILTLCSICVRPIAEAQAHGGGGHGGGGGGHGGGGAHGGGVGHGGGAGHVGVSRGVGVGRVGGVGYRGGYYGGYYGWGGFGFGLGLGLGYGYGYGYGYPGYGYGYGGYGYPGYGYDYPDYYDPNYGPPPGAYPQPGEVPPNGTPPGPTGGWTGTPPAKGTDTNAMVGVRVPADATVWINGAKTNQGGTSREFMSAGLERGRTYTYDIRAQWKAADGKPVDLDQRITVQAGEKRWVDFSTLYPLHDQVIPAVVSGTPR